MSQYIQSQIRKGALGADEEVVDYLHPDRPFQWQNGGLCMDVRNGSKVDSDACEGSYKGWYKAQQAAIAAKAAGLPPPRPTATSKQPAWLLPAAVVGIGLLGFLVLKKG